MKLKFDNKKNSFYKVFYNKKTLNKNKKGFLKVEIYFNNITRRAKKDIKNNYYIKYNNEKYILTNISDNSTILVNEKFNNYKILAVLIKT